MSPYHFARLFRELAGISPHRYLLRIRLHHAKKLLAAGSSITDACFDTGYSNLSHFVKTFKAHFGVTPSRARGNS